MTKKFQIMSKFQWWNLNGNSEEQKVTWISILNTINNK